LPGRLTWKDYLYDDGAWEVHTDALGRFETPRRVPAFLKCSAQVRREGRGPATSSATFAPTTPSFFDIEIPRDPPADEKVVWERVQAGLNAYNNAAFDEARGRYAEALEEAERLERKAPLLRAYLLQQQAHACRMLEKYDDAKALYRLALDLRREALGEDDPLAVGLLNDLAYSDKMAGHYVEMAKELHEVLRWSKGRRANPLFARCSLILGDMCSWELKNYRNSENFLNYSYHAYEEIYGPDAWQLIDVLNCQALNQERAGAPDQAEPLARRAVEIADRYQYGRSPSSQLYMASLLEAHARVLKALGRGEEAKKAGTRAKGLRELRKPGAVQ
jgi:tetratricopeptide (TPR) repeat protein